ncbi:hypothetical protein HDU89_002590 [Geranomyces variabilis]|nr:hypothetical protein HDU89_002590 [Geranomyces variabilis]
MAKAYEAQFKRYHESGEFTAPAFRSARAPVCSITIPPQNWSKQPDRRWQCYVTTLENEGKLRVRKRDQRRVLDMYPEGPVREVKIVQRAGKWYMHVPVYKAIEALPADAEGHLVSLDPGSNPFMTYYSPTCLLLLRLRRHFPSTDVDVSDGGNFSAMNGSKIACANYIHASTFATEEMVPRVQNAKRRKINNQTARDLLAWCHAPFKRALAMKVEEVRGLVVEFGTEEYTTMTVHRDTTLPQTQSFNLSQGQYREAASHSSYKLSLNHARRFAMPILYPDGLSLLEFCRVVIRRLPLCSIKRQFGPEVSNAVPAISDTKRRFGRVVKAVPC